VTEERIESAGREGFQRRCRRQGQGPDKRENYALDLFRERRPTDDPDRVRVLRELGSSTSRHKYPHCRSGNQARDRNPAPGRERELALKILTISDACMPLEHDDSAELRFQEQLGYAVVQS